MRETRTQLVLVLPFVLSAVVAHAQTGAAKSPDEIRLKDYRPRVLHKLPVTNVEKARYPVIDMHAHPRYAKTPEEIDRWVEVMDAVGVEKTILLTGASGEEFDRLVELYAKHKDRFELWCGFDYTGFEKPGYGPA